MIWIWLDCGLILIRFWLDFGLIRALIALAALEEVPGGPQEVLGSDTWLPREAPSKFLEAPGSYKKL